MRRCVREGVRGAGAQHRERIGEEGGGDGDGTHVGWTLAARGPRLYSPHRQVQGARGAPQQGGRGEGPYREDLG